MLSGTVTRPPEISATGDEGHPDRCWAEPVLIAPCCGHFICLAPIAITLENKPRLSSTRVMQSEAGIKGLFPTQLLSPETSLRDTLYCHPLSDPGKPPGTDAPQPKKKTRLASPQIVSQLWSSSADLMDMCKKCNFRKDDSIPISRTVSN